MYERVAAYRVSYKKQKWVKLGTVILAQNFRYKKNILEKRMVASRHLFRLDIKDVDWDRRFSDWKI